MLSSKAYDTDQALNDSKKVLKTVQDVADLIPLPGVGPALSTLISLIEKIEETRSNRKGLNAVSSEVKLLVDTINEVMSQARDKVEDIPSDDPRHDPLLKGIRESSDLKTRIEKFSRDLEALKEKANEVFDRRWYIRWVFSSRDAAALEELRQGIADCKEYFKLKCQVAIELSVNEILKKLTEIEDEKTLELLPRAGASYRAEAVATKSRFLPGMRAEVFKAIDDWVQGSQELSGKAVCILTGDAGTGKSTIACEFARMRDEEKKDYGASFFFVRGEADLDSTKLVFPTLAYQLAQSQDALYPHIVKAAREHLKRDKIQQMKYQAPSLIHGPVHEIGDTHPSMVLVVDALDECSESERTRSLVPEMLDLLLASVRQARFPLRILFTSRPDPLIEKTLCQPQWASLVHKISLDTSLSPESVQQDMTIFVRDKLERQPSVQALLRDRPKVAEHLAKRARGQFVYAQTAIDFLSDYPRFVDGGLDDLLSKGSSTFATKLQPLDDLYLTVLETALPSSEDQPLPHALRPMLGNLAVLRNPMSLVVLEALTGVQCDDIYKVLTPLRAVVAFNEAQPGEKVRVKHSTFSAFLLDKKRCMNKTYYDDASHHHSRLVVQCLGALQTLKENMIRLPDTTVPKAEVPNLVERLEEHVPGHVQYACMHWAAHLGDACRMKSKKTTPNTDCYCWEIGKSLEDFIGSGTPTKLRMWVEIMAYMGRLDTVAEALRVAQEHLKVVSDYEGVKSQLAETEKLLADHYSEIEECPYKVYQF